MLSLSIIGNILQVKSGSEIGSMTEVLNLEKKGDDLEEIFFNSRFLLDPLRIFEDTFIEIEFNGPLVPVFLTIIKKRKMAVIFIVISFFPLKGKTKNTFGRCRLYLKKSL